MVPLPLPSFDSAPPADRVLPIEDLVRNTLTLELHRDHPDVLDSVSQNQGRLPHTDQVTRNPRDGSVVPLVHQQPAIESLLVISGSQASITIDRFVRDEVDEGLCQDLR